MKRTVAALALLLIPQIAGAEAVPDPDSFHVRVAAISSDASVAGQWFDLLPVIAERCNMAIDQDALTRVVQRFAIPAAVDQAADYYVGRHENPLQVAWNADVRRDPNVACRFAEEHWGDSGTQFPGLLRDLY